MFQWVKCQSYFSWIKPNFRYRKKYNRTVIPGTTTLVPYLVSQIAATHLKTMHPPISTTGAQTANVLQGLDYTTGDLDNIPGKGCPDTCPIWMNKCKDKFVDSNIHNPTMLSHRIKSRGGVVIKRHIKSLDEVKHGHSCREVVYFMLQSPWPYAKISGVIIIKFLFINGMKT